LKLVHNMICHTIFLATSEGGPADRAARHPARDAIAVINAGNSCRYISKARFPNHIIPRTFDGLSRTANLGKDLAMAAELARQGGQTGAYGALTARLLARVLEQGLGEEDFTRLYEHLSPLMQADVPSP
jgi:3-hydroxyisobutyrate dehydrogenase